MAPWGQVTTWAAWGWTPHTPQSPGTWPAARSPWVAEPVSSPWGQRGLRTPKGSAEGSGGSLSGGATMHLTLLPIPVTRDLRFPSQTRPTWRALLHQQLYQPVKPWSPGWCLSQVCPCQPPVLCPGHLHLQPALLPWPPLLPSSAIVPGASQCIPA